MSDPIFYIIGGYVPNGGTRMAYELGVIAHRDLGLPVKIVVVKREAPERSVFKYPVSFECTPLETLPELVRPCDILVCNPSFSAGELGLAYDCRKLMYVQGFNTFSLLDRWFDRYVAGSTFVRDFLKTVYDIETPVIPPFVDPAPAGPAWEARPADSLIIFMKGDPNLRQRLVARLRSLVEALNPAVAAKIAWDAAGWPPGKIAQAEFRSRLANTQRLLVLSVAEGFGLVPLEAMAAGATVIGFDGFGGRDYMRPGVNCAVRPYPDLAGVAHDLVDSFERPDWAAALAAQGPATATPYTVERFTAHWRPILQALIE